MRYLLSESDLPLASSINYDATEEVVAYALLLTVRYRSRLAERHNTFGIIREGRNWLREVELASAEFPAVTLPEVCTCYRQIYRLCWKADAPISMVKDWLQRIFRSLISGDTSVIRSKVVEMMQGIISNNPRAVNPEYLRWYVDVTARWVKTLLREGTFRDESPEENFSRLTILLGEDLYPCLGKEEDSIKKQWINSNSDLDISEMDLNTLLSYRRFLAAASPYLSSNPQSSTKRTPVPEEHPVKSAITCSTSRLPEEYKGKSAIAWSSTHLSEVEQCKLLDREVLTRLALHPDLHQFARTAYTEELTLLHHPAYA